MQNNSYKISFVQEGIWFDQNLDPSHNGYNICVKYVLKEDISSNILRKRIEVITSENEILRSYFSFNGEIRRNIADMDIDVIYTQEKLKNSNLDQYHALVKGYTQKQFDVSNPPLFRVIYFNLENEENILLIISHHLILDGISLQLLLKEILFNNKELNRSNKFISDYNYNYHTDHERDYFKSKKYIEDKEYWVRQLKEVTSIFKLNTHVKEYKKKGDSLTFNISQKDIYRFLHTNKCSVFDFSLLTFTILLHYFSELDRIVIGLPVSGRSKFHNKNMLGVFINAIMLKIDLHQSNSIIEILQTIKQKVFSGIRHQSFPLHHIYKELDNKENQFTRVFFNYLSFIDQDQVDNPYEIFSGNYGLDMNLDINFYTFDTSETIYFRLDYKKELFPLRFINKIKEQFIYISQLLVENKEFDLGELTEKIYQNILNKEKRDIKKVAIGQKFELPKTSLIDLIDICMLETPNHVAYQFNNHSITYKELMGKSNSLANELSHLGIQKGKLVPVLMNKSIELPLSILAILKTGAAFVPLDSHWPEQRIIEIIREIDSSLILTQAAINLDFLPNKINTIIIEYKNLLCDELENKYKIYPDDLIYGIYTSGSTGKPKCSLNYHKGILNRFLYMNRRYNCTKDDVILFNSRPIFDASVWQMFWPLINSATTVIPDDEFGIDFQNMTDLIYQYKVTISDFVPSVFNLWVDYIEQSGRKESILSLNHLLIGGEAMSSYSIIKLKNIHPGINITNTYGPTEASIGTVFYEVGDHIPKIIPIGTPIDNVLAVILNDKDQLATFGEVGELHLGGICLSRGYLNDEDLTIRKFIDYSDSILGNSKLYKTGDLAYYGFDNDIYFIGRKDFQLKINGIRLEPKEIESCIERYQGVERSVVVCNPKNKNSLVGYIISKQKVSGSKLKSFLGLYLPNYMIPKEFISVKEFPYNSIGKIDLKKLPQPENKLISEIISPRNRTEKKLAEIWAYILGLELEKISINANFFEIGGHSLKATRLVYKIQDIYNKKIELRQIFNLTTIEEQAKLINQLTKTENCIIQPVPKQDNYELSGSQRRLWILCHLEGASIAYNMPFTFSIEGNVDLPALQKAIESLIERHESLRTVFIEINGEPRQKILQTKELPNVYDIIDLQDKKNYEQKVNELLENKIKQPFDLTNGPLITFTLYRLTVTKNVLLFNLHHMISDGWSMKVIVRDLMDFYQSYKERIKNVPQPLSIHYKDYATWINDQQSENKSEANKKYWINQFKNDIPILDFPTDRPRPKIQKYNGKQLFYEINEQETRKIKTFCQQENVTLFMALLAFVKTLIYRYTNQNDFNIGIPIAGRENAGLENQIGFYVNTLVLRAQFKENICFRDLLLKVKETTLEAYEHQNYGFERLVEDLKIKRDLSRNPFFDIMVVLQNTDLNTTFSQEMDALNLKPYYVKNVVSKLDIVFNFAEQEDKINCKIEYNTDLFDENRIHRLYAHFLNIANTTINKPDVNINEFEILTDLERNQIQRVFNDTDTDYPKHKTIIHLFEEAVRKYTYNTALVCSTGKELTYKELNCRVLSLATSIMEYNIGKEDIVAIIADRSVEMIVAIYAILKARAAFLPIDPDYPNNRISYILQDSNAKLVIANSKEVTKKLNINNSSINDCLIQGKPLPIIDLQTYNYKKNVNLPSVNSMPIDLAYVIYTSGSTGKPKGVMIEHRSLSNIIQYLQKQYPLLSDDTYLFKTTYTFDVSVAEIFGWFLQGGKLAILEKDGEKDPEKIINAITNQNITHINFVPSLFSVFIDNPKFFLLKNSKLKHILLAGEALLPGIVQRFKDLKSNIQLENIYGPTEATIYSCRYSLKNWSSKTPVFIGKPIDNIKVYVSNNKNRLQPIGVPGELIIVGDNIARGYINNSSMNHEKIFIDTFFPECKKAYKTGDLVRYREDGNIEFIGRIDTQVKLRGFRIELGEIEKCIEEFVGVKKVVVIIINDNSVNKRLVCYYTGNSKIEEDKLKSWLAQKLPDYMIPHKIIWLKELPITNSGKIDRKKLQLLDFNVKEKIIFPRNDTEEKLVEIWRKVLGIEKKKICIEDDFFMLGGNSLSAINVIQECSAINYKITLTDIFHYKTISALANYISISKERKYQLNDTNDILSYLKKETGNEVIIRSYKTKDNKNKHKDYNIIYSAIIDNKSIERIEELLKSKINVKYLPHYILPIEQAGIIKHNEVLDKTLFFDFLKLEKTKNSLKKHVEYKIQQDYQTKNHWIKQEGIIKEFSLSPIQILQSNFKTPPSVGFFSMDGHFDKVYFKKAYRELIKTQPLLRSTLVKKNDTYSWQEYAYNNDDCCEIPFFDLSRYDDLSLLRMMQEIISNIRYEDNSILFQIIIVKKNLREHYIVLLFDHIIYDRGSREVIERHLRIYYNNLIQNKSIQIEDIKPYEDYSRLASQPYRTDDNAFINIFKLQEFSENKNKILTSLSNKTNNKRYSFQIAVPLKEVSMEIALTLYVRSIKYFINIEKMPVLFVLDNRRFGVHSFYNTVGEFIDFIPLVLESKTNPHSISKTISQRLNFLKNNEINCLNFLTISESTSGLDNIKELINPGYKFSDIDILMFNYLGNHNINETWKDNYNPEIAIIENPLGIHTFFNCITESYKDGIIFSFGITQEINIEKLKEVLLKEAEHIGNN